MDNLNYAFIAVFCLEALLKIAAMGFSTYISNSWNK
ncbi:MAG: ion transporter [bacterium]